MLYSWQLPETYMQSAPAALRLKHARCIRLKTGKINLKKKKKKTKQGSLSPSNQTTEKITLFVSVTSKYLSDNLKLKTLSYKNVA